MVAHRLASRDGRFPHTDLRHVANPSLTLQFAANSPGTVARLLSPPSSGEGLRCLLDGL